MYKLKESILIRRMRESDSRFVVFKFVFINEFGGFMRVLIDIYYYSKD